MSNSVLVSSDWLHAHLHDPNLVVLDASIPKVGETGPHPLADVQIPGARFFDLNGEFSDKNTDLPHNMPDPAVFSDASRRLGISSSSQIVVYDHHGIYVSPRVWWMYRAMGHRHIAVLDGGLPGWLQGNFEVASKQTNPPSPASGDFSAELQAGLVWNAEQLLQNLEQASAKVVDARSPGRFSGTQPEPRPGLNRGHIPGSCNLPFDQVIRDGHFLPKDELEAKFKALELGDSPLVFSCGSGVTACVIMLACELVMNNPKAVYDGSWAEWGIPDKNFPTANEQTERA